MSSTPSVLRQPVSSTSREGSYMSNRKEIVSSSPEGIESYFPGESFREGQREAIHAIYDAFVNKSYRFVVAELPTGVGKSLIAVTFARYFKRAHILTPQKILQTQYEETAVFTDVVSMKGRSAYRCTRLLETAQNELAKEMYDVNYEDLNIVAQQQKVIEELNLREKDGTLDISCNKGPCRKNSRIKCDDCDYTKAIVTANQSDVTVHNFDSFHFQTLFAHAFAKRPILICDEGHNIEGKYLNFMEFQISNRKFPQFRLEKDPTIDRSIDFLKTVYEDLKVTSAQLTIQKDEEGLSEQEVRVLDDANSLLQRIGLFFTRLQQGMEYVVDYVEDRDSQAYKFRPINVGAYVNETLFTYGDKVLILSATIVDKNFFCKNVGLDPKDVAFVQVDSSFPPENRPIFKRYAGSMAYADIAATLPKLMSKIEFIMSKFPKSRGIIQTHTERIANTIKTTIHNPRLTFRKDYRTVEEMLAVHLSKPGSVIVTSGLREGLDLRDDQSRFQIICKVPYLDLSDKRTNRKKEKDPNWYGISTVLMWIQMIGRSIRSKDDKAATYLLDSCFESFLTRNRRYIPKYIRNAIHEENIQ